MKIYLCGTSAFIIREGLESVSLGGARVNVTDIKNEPIEGYLSLREIGQSNEITYFLSAGECIVPNEAFILGKKYEISLIIEQKRILAGELFVTNDDILSKCCYPVSADNTQIWRVCADMIAFLGETRESLMHT